MQLAEFIEEFKDAITQQTMQNYRPLYTFDMSPFQERLRKLRRKPFNSQSHCISGLSKCFENGQRSAFLVGEMGVGKTLIGAATAYVAGFKRVLVLCPPHLVKKWEREIKSTVPLSRVFILKTTDDVNRAVDLADGDRTNYFIISRERAKLSYSWKPVFIQPPVRAGHPCHDIACPSCGGLILNEEGLPVSIEEIQRKKWRCKNEIEKDKLCNAPLWQADREGPRRFSLAEYIKKNYKGYFDFLILDECHEYKGQGSAQGYAVAALASSCQNVLAMTGTLLGGYSTSLFYLLYRLTNDFKKIFGHNDSIRFAQKYGILERICRQKQGKWSKDGVSSKRRSFSTTTIERPGVSPEIITHLINKTAFMRLSDVAEVLPPYQDIVETIDMEGDQKEEYKKFSETLQEELRKELKKGSKKLLGAYLQSLLCYPDAPWREEVVMRRDGDQEEIVASAPALCDKTIYPKERRAIELCLEEKRKGRKVIIYCTHTETKDITERLKNLLEARGLKTVLLKSHTVSSEKREDWVKEKVQEGIDVLICQPKLVQTGLDLIDFPTLIFYQIEYSVYTVRQASRRSWRIGQKNPVKVYYLTYAETIQEKGLQLVAKKVRASLMVEGELLAEGLSAAGAEADMLTQLAKSLVESTSAKESAEALFSSCRESFNFNQSFIGAQVADIADTIEDIQEAEVKESQEEPSVSLLWDDLRTKYKPRKSSSKEFINDPNQLVLF